MIIKINKTVIYVFLIVVTVITGCVGTIKYVSAMNISDGIRLPIVMYHQLTKSSSKTGKYVLSVEQFENDLIYLKNNGYNTITTLQLMNYVNGNGDLPEKAIMLTFDDGCETLYSYALPLLEKYGYSAVGFIVGAFADKYTELNDHNLNYSCLDWNEIKELSDGGIIDIQSHSFNLHNNTSERSGAEKKKGESFDEYNEFLVSDASIMDEKMMEYTGKKPVAFAYPFGSYSKESAEILKKFGYKMVLTCEERVNIIKKSEPEVLFRLGRYNRPDGVCSAEFFEKMGIG